MNTNATVARACLLGIALELCTIATNAQTTAPAASNASTAATGDSLAEVVVTAQRRDRERADRADRDLRHFRRHTRANLRREQRRDAAGSGARTRHLDGHRQYQDLPARRGHHRGRHRQFGGRLRRRRLHSGAGIFVHEPCEHRSRRGGQGSAGNPVRPQYHRRRSSDRHQDSLIHAVRRPDFRLRQLQYVHAELLRNERHRSESRRGLRLLLQQSAGQPGHEPDHWHEEHLPAERRSASATSGYGRRPTPRR